MEQWKYNYFILKEGSVRGCDRASVPPLKSTTELTMHLTVRLSFVNARQRENLCKTTFFWRPMYAITLFFSSGLALFRPIRLLFYDV